MKQVGIIVAGSAYPMDGFKSGLQDLGWVEGKNLSLQIRAAEGQLHLLPEFAAAIVNTGVDLIAVIGAVTVSNGAPSHLVHSDRVCGGCRADRRRIGQEAGTPRPKRHRCNHL
jgi:ABC-type uncharacterized transport system substrate-binding protein